MKDIFGIFAIGSRRSSRAKSLVFLLAFIFSILVEISYALPATTTGQRLILHTSKYRQRYHQQLLQKGAQAPPITTTTHRHHLHLRSAPNMPLENPNGNHNNNIEELKSYCNTLNYSLNKVHQQANATYSTIRANLNDYIDNQYKTPKNDYNTSNIYEQWKCKLDSMLFEHPYMNLTLRNFDHVHSDMHFEDRFKNQAIDQTLAEEFPKIYKTLQILHRAFSDVISYRKNNASRLRNELVRMNDENQDDHENAKIRFEKINEFFSNAHRHTEIDLGELDDAMRLLNIESPENYQPEPLNMQEEEFVARLLLPQQYLSVMQYFRSLYAYLMRKCPTIMEE